MYINGRPWSPQSDDAAGGASSRGPHRLEGVKKCNAKWHFRYGMEETRGRLLSVVNDKVPLTGTALHSRAADYNAKRLPKLPKWVTDKTVEERVMDDVRGHPEAEEIAALSADMWQACVDQTPEDDVLTPHSVEREVWIPLGEIDPTCPPSLRDEIVTARLDLIAMQHKGRHKGQLVIWDYKTTGGYKKKGSDSVSLPHWDAKNPWWTMHFQGALALAIARAMFNLPVMGFYIIRVSRTAPHVIDRRLLNIPAAVVARAGKMATEAVMEEQRVLERIERKLPVLQTGIMTGVCGDFGGCEYLSLCQANTKEERLALLDADYFWQKS